MLEVKDLRISFRTEHGRVRAVDGVSFDVAQSEILCVVGESGSGKTISLLSVMGLINDPNAVIEGSIVYKGRELLGLPQRELRHVRGREIAMIFQDPMTSLTPVYTVGWQIAEQIRAHEKVTKKAALERAVGLLGEVGIPDAARRLHQYPHEFSGGMRQRVMIAMALSCHPALLIADEPTTALDVTTQTQILELMRQLQREDGMAIMLITHDLGVVAEMATDVAVMYLGRVVEQAPVDAIFHAPQHPYTRALLRSIPRMRARSRARLTPIVGAVPHPYDRPSGCPFHPRCADFMAGTCDRRAPSSRPVGDQHTVSCFLYE